MVNIRKSIKELDGKPNRDSAVLAAAMASALAAGGPEAQLLKSALSGDATKVLASSGESAQPVPEPPDNTPEPEADAADTDDAPSTPNEEPVQSEAEGAPTAESTASSEVGGVDVTKLTTALYSQMVKPLQEKFSKLQSDSAEKEQKADAERKAFQAEIASLTANLEAAQVSSQVLNDVSRLMGAENGIESNGTAKKSSEDSSGYGQTPGRYAGVNFNTHVATNSDTPVGIMAEVGSVLSSCNQGNFRSPSSGRIRPVVDTGFFDKYVRSNKAQIMDDMETMLKSNGFLRGSMGGTRIVSAATTATDVLGGFLPTLSSIMRDSHRAGKIFHQFARTRVDFSEGDGGSVRVPRAAYQPRPTDPNQRLLSGRGTYVSITDQNQSIKTGLVPIDIEEWGLGKDENNSPVAIPMFVAAYSMIDLVGILTRNLWEDYTSWEDLKARSLWAATSATIYNNGGNVVDDPAEVVAGGDGRCTYGFLQSVGDIMYEGQVPPFNDGCYGIALPTRQLTTLRQSMDKNLQATKQEDIETITNYLKISTGGHIDRVTGYKGLVGNMHVFSSNGWGIGGPANEGVQSETLGTGATVNTSTAYAFGADTIGRGVGSPFEIRLDERTEFNRIMRAIWIEESGWAPFDVDPIGYSDTSDVPQQRRVFDVRCTSVEV